MKPILENELFRAYVKIVASRINSLPLRFIRGGAFSRPGKKASLRGPFESTREGLRPSSEKLQAI